MTITCDERSSSKVSSNAGPSTASRGRWSGVPEICRSLLFRSIVIDGVQIVLLMNFPYHGGNARVGFTLDMREKQSADELLSPLSIES